MGQVTWGLYLHCFSLRVRFCYHFPQISGQFFAFFKGMGITFQRKLSSYSLLPCHPGHETSSASIMYCQSCWQSSDIFCESSFKTDVWYHVSHFNVWVHYLAILLKYSFRFSRWDVRFYISNKLPGNVGAAWPWTTIRVVGYNLHTEKCT